MRFSSLFFLLVFMIPSLSKAIPQTVHNQELNEEFSWKYAAPESQGFSSAKLASLVEDQAAMGCKKLMIIRNDTVVCSWFAEGFEDSIRGHYTASLAKSIVSGMSLLAAMDDELIRPDDPAARYIPQWSGDYKKSKISIRQLAGHTSGIEDAEVPGMNTHMELPGWKGQFWRQEPDPFSVSRDSAPVIFTPGQQYHYSNPGIAMLNYAVTAALKGGPGQDIRSYLRDRIYRPIGIQDSEYSVGYGKSIILDSLSLVGGWGGGSFTANAAARVGRLMLRQGNWQGKQLIDTAWIREALSFEETNNLTYPSEREKGENPFLATTLGWYSNHDGIWKYLPRDAFAGAGAQNQLLLVIPSLDLIVVRFGAQLDTTRKKISPEQAAVEWLFNPVMDAFEAAPYPKSDLITGIEFAPAEEVVRLAQGSDNWPATWGDDDQLYTAYGDGRGFSPYEEIKLSLGLAKISGNPPDIQGVNIPSPSGERVGDGKFGPKASGMLMVDGVLYMLVRNVQNSQLAWSEDHGISWTWAHWKFSSGMGCPTFLNYGENYRGARDNYVYLYAADTESAYLPGDAMTLARVPKSEIRDRDRYEYFSGYDAENKAIWKGDFKSHRSVFNNPGRCYRSGITYNKGLKRYLWCQVFPIPSGENKGGPRFDGGMGIYEAPEPWGPWKTVYYSLKWDMGPGETASLPPKWMSEDGKTCNYLFSGDDYFSVRTVEFITEK